MKKKSYSTFIFLVDNVNSDLPEDMIGKVFFVVRENKNYRIIKNSFDIDNVEVINDESLIGKTIPQIMVTDEVLNQTNIYNVIELSHYVIEYSIIDNTGLQHNNLYCNYVVYSEEELKELKKELNKFATIKKTIQI